MKTFVVLLVLVPLLGFSSTLCEGDRVIDLAGNCGTVKGIQSSLRATVKLDEYQQAKKIFVSELSKSEKCVDNFCVEDRIIDQFESIGTVKEIFANGRAIVKPNDSKKEYVIEIDNLGRVQKCLNAFCSGDKITNTDGLSGIILEIFSNGKVSVKYDNYPNPSIVDLAQIYKQTVNNSN